MTSQTIMKHSLRMTAAALCTSVGLLVAPSAKAAVWIDTNSWSNEWEERYALWVEEEFHSRIFIDGRYGKIATDCADAVYAARLIFAYENKLPFVFSNGSGLTTNRTSAFDSASEGTARVKRFLFSVFEQTSTKTLPRDTYPVAINRNTIRAGTVWLRPSREAELSLLRLFGGKKQEPGHTDTVKSVSNEGILTLIGSTVPAQVRELKEVTDFFIMPEKNAETGLRNWKWPEHYKMSISSLPGYSLEQYEMGQTQNSAAMQDGIGAQGGASARTLPNWANDVKSKLALSSESKGAYLARLAKNFCALVKDRVSVVASGENLRKKLGGSCMSYSQWDSYSTPGRDQMIMKSLKKLVSEANFFGFLTRGGIEKTRPYLEKCGTLEYMPGRTADYLELAHRYADDRISSDPNHPIEARWGEMQKPQSVCKYKED
ncbi:MAG: hypothetical protein AAGB31_13280 [Bdellovibrio sp.]